MMLVANDTAERRILEPLARRAARAHGTAKAVGVVRRPDRVSRRCRGHGRNPGSAHFRRCAGRLGVHLRRPSERGARGTIRLGELRGWITRANQTFLPSGVAATLLQATRGGIADGVVCVYTLSLITADGNVRHAELTIVHDRWRPPAVPETPAALRSVVSAFRRARGAAIEERLVNRLAERVKDITTRCDIATACAAEREEAVVGLVRAKAQHLVQASLFNRPRGPLQPPEGLTGRLEDAGNYRGRLTSTSLLTPTLDLSAILIVAHRRRT